MLADLLAQQDLRARHVLDLGAGTGILGLISAAAAGAGGARVTLVELHPETAALAQRNAEAAAALHDVHVDVRVSDIRALSGHDLEAPADLIVTNPPWFEPGSGRESSNPASHAATHALAGNYHDFVAAACGLRAPGGVIWVLAPADHLADVLATLDPDRIAVHHVVLVWGRHRARPLRAWIAMGDAGVTTSHTHVCCYTAR